MSFPVIATIGAAIGLESAFSGMFPSALRDNNIVRDFWDVVSLKKQAAWNTLEISVRNATSATKNENGEIVFPEDYYGPNGTQARLKEQWKQVVRKSSDIAYQYWTRFTGVVATAGVGTALFSLAKFIPHPAVQSIAFLGTLGTQAITLFNDHIQVRALSTLKAAIQGDVNGLESFKNHPLSELANNFRNGGTDILGKTNEKILKFIRGQGKRLIHYRFFPGIAGFFESWKESIFGGLAKSIQEKILSFA
ncbi:MAG: hypothetical protein QNJ31_00900 [Candidatus Caenarcaniphilales bacterium]|nr:hypothetical protein [Candidatus Caenarcaniphilales bacterium]